MPHHPRRGTWADAKRKGRERQYAAIRERGLTVGCLVTLLSGERGEVAAIVGHQVFLVDRKGHYNPASLTRVAKKKGEK